MGKGIPRSSRALLFTELDMNLFEEDYARAETSIKNLYSTEIYQKLEHDPSVQVTIEQRDSMQMAGVKIWVQSDLIAEYKSGDIEIVDWKTGKETDGNDIRIQLGIYALYVKSKWDIHPSKISVREVNLYAGKETKHPIDIEWMNEALSYIRNSVIEMQKLLARPERNLPLSEQYFPMTQDVKLCRHCKFRGKCHRAEHITPDNIVFSRYVPSFEHEYKRLESV